MDPTRLRQILLNLMGNSIKFTHAGEVNLLISLGENVGVSSNIVDLNFQIKDTGIGIEAEKLEHIFDKFSQADTSTTRKYGGTGLGLTISKNLIEMMGGEVSVQSHLHNGTEFRFNCVFRISNMQSDKKIVPKIQDSQKVMIVDDNTTNREILSTQLKAWGIDVVEADSAQNCLKATQSQTDIDLFILDMQMPDKNGIELAQDLKKIEAYENTPLLLLSSMGMNKSVMPASLFDLVLHKPIRFYLLKDAIVQFFGSSKSLQTQTQLRSKSKEMVHILLAEDNDTNQKVAVGILKKLGYAGITVVEDGQRALDALTYNEFDLIFMDIQMPIMDGFEATTKIRFSQKNKGNKRTPIVAMTAHAMQGDREKCILSGMDDYIQKPLNPQNLSEILERWAPTKQSHEIKKGESGVNDDTTLFNYKELLARLMDDDELLSDIVQGYIEDSLKQIHQIQHDFQSGNWLELRKQAHTLKGASANVCAEKIREISADLEQNAEANNESKIKERVAQIFVEHTRFVSYFQENHTK